MFKKAMLLTTAYLFVASNVFGAAIETLTINDMNFRMGAPTFAEGDAVNVNDPTDIIAAGTGLGSAVTTRDILVAGAFNHDPFTDGELDLTKNMRVSGEWATEAAFGGFGLFHGNTVEVDSISGLHYRALSGDIDDATGEMTVDLNSWTAYWGINYFNQGTTDPIDGSSETVSMFVDNGSAGIEEYAFTSNYTTNNGDGTYELVWVKTIVGGAFGGQVGHWSMNVTPTTIPEPASMLLIGTGLAGLVGIRRKKTA